MIWFFRVGALLLILALGAGCKGDECRQMQACCDEVRDVEGIESACGGLAQNVTKPETCISVLQTVGYIYEDRGMELPEACQLPK